jgi:hypothetical protein
MICRLYMGFAMHKVLSVLGLLYSLVLPNSATAQIDCQRLANALASQGIYTDSQKADMTAVYQSDCSGQGPPPVVSAPSPPAPEPSLTFVVQNNTGGDLELTFKSQHRDAWWPGNNQVYLLGNGQSRSYPLTCMGGESICYGASRHFFFERYWGGGSNHEYGCTDCCYVCGAGMTSITLTP